MIRVLIVNEVRLLANIIASVLDIRYFGLIKPK
jgi:type IV secretory pathway protease TraF